MASLSLYVSTLAPSVVALFDDSLEFQLVTYQLGIAHPTGYPLYTLLGKLFTLLPAGNVAYRVNLMSAVFGAATVALTYLLIVQIAAPDKLSAAPISPSTNQQINKHSAGGYSPSPWPIHLGGAMGACLLAVSLVFWQQATIAEVYTLNAFFVVALFLTAARLRQLSRGISPANRPHHQDPSADKSMAGNFQSLNRVGVEHRRILWLAFLTGLSLTHHRTMLLVLPALAYYLDLIRRDLVFNRNRLVLSGLFGLLPLLLYLYLPLRGHVGSLDGTYENTWAGFWRQVSASGYGLFIFDNPFGHERTPAFYWDLLVSQFYTAVPGFIGLFYLLWMRRWKMLALTGIAFVTYTGFNLFYKVSDIEVFFIPVFIIWAVWSGSGAAFLLHIASSLPHRPWRPVWAGVIGLMFVFIIGQLFQANQATIRASYTWRVHDYGLDILQQPLPAGGQSAIAGILGEMTLLRYFQQTEDRRPDLELVAADLEGNRLAAVEKLLAQGKSVYLTRELPGTAERWSLNAVGPLIRVDPEPVTRPPEFSFGVDQVVIPDIRLLGYDLSRPPHTGPGLPPVRLTLFWQVLSSPVSSLKVSARLLSPAGEPLTATDAVPVHFAYPTIAWRSGEIISDVYDLVLPVDTPAGPYTPLLIWYDPAQNAAEVGRIELQPVVVGE